VTLDGRNLSRSTSLAELSNVEYETRFGP